MNLPRSLPNQITFARLVLAAMLFVILQLVGWAEQTQGDLAASILARTTLLLNLGAAIFLLAAISDVLDGRIARAWNLTTDFGRIADPFADKVIVSGAFLFLVPIAGSGVRAWMVVLIVARESLVDGLRGFSESRGVPFPASFWGKAKMTTQCTALTTILIVLANKPNVDAVWAARGELIQDFFTYLAVAVTAISGAVYVFRARALLGRGASGERVPAAGSRLQEAQSR